MFCGLRGQALLQVCISPPAKPKASLETQPATFSISKTRSPALAGFSANTAIIPQTVRLNVWFSAISSFSCNPPLVLESGRQVARHCDRLFPPDLAAAGRLDPAVVAARLRESFIVLGRKNERKRLASQLELKMRAIYYDVIDPAAVEGYIASIYQEVGRGGAGAGRGEK